jgi:hypothetical protein
MCGGSGGIAPPFLTSLIDGGEWSVSRFGRFILRYPLERRIVGPQSQLGRCGVEKNLVPLPGIELRPSSPSLSRLGFLEMSLEFIRLLSHDSNLGDTEDGYSIHKLIPYILCVRYVGMST